MVTEFIYVMHERGREEIQYCLEEPVLVRRTHICKPKQYNQETPQEQSSRQTFAKDKIVKRGCAAEDLQVSLDCYKKIHSIIAVQHMMCL